MKYSIEKQRYKNVHATIELNPKPKAKTSRFLSGSSSTKNIIKKEVSFDTDLDLNLKTQVQPEVEII